VGQFLFALDRILVDERTVGAAEIAHENLAALDEQGAVALANNGAGRPQLALRIATDHKLGERDRDCLSLGLPIGHHHQAHFHGWTSFPAQVRIREWLRQIGPKGTEAADRPAQAFPLSPVYRAFSTNAASVEKSSPFRRRRRWPTEPEPAR